MTPPLGAPFLGYATELARARLDALPFADYADPDPGRLPLDEDACTCTPCPGRGNDGHGLTHCAECCYGTIIEDADPSCPVAAHRALDAARYGGAS